MASDGGAFAAPVVENPTEFSVDVDWSALASKVSVDWSDLAALKVAGVDGVDGPCEVRIKLRQIPDAWEEAQLRCIRPSSEGATTFTLDNLEPTSTYQLRYAFFKNEAAVLEGRVVTFDTQVANCTPTPRCALL